MAFLLSLPDELISYIFIQPFISNQSLFNLSLCARRLNNICLPYFLSRFHVFLDQPSTQTLINVNLSHITAFYEADIIDAINHAVFPVTIKNLRLKFPPPPESLEQLNRQFNRICHIFTRLPSLEVLEVEFNNFSGGFANDSDHVLQGWVESLGAMLNAAVAAGCRSLTMSGSASYMTASYKLRQSWRKSFSALGVLLNRRSPSMERVGMSGYKWKYPRRSYEWEYLRNSGLGQQTHLPQLSAQLKAKPPPIHSIHIETSILLTPPFSVWVLQLMTLSNITRLTLCDVFLRVSDWTIIIPLLAASSPHLSEFSSSRCINMPAAALVAFVTQCTELRAISLDEHTPLFPPSSTLPTSPAPPLSNLKYLTCPSRTAKYLLASQPLDSASCIRRLTYPLFRQSIPTSPLLSKLTVRATDAVVIAADPRSSIFFSMPDLDQCMAPIVSRFLQPHYDGGCSCTASDVDQTGQVSDPLRKCTLPFPWIELNLPFHALDRDNIASQVAWAAETLTHGTDRGGDVGRNKKFSKKRKEEAPKKKRRNGWEWLSRVKGLKLELKDRLFVLEDEDRRERDDVHGTPEERRDGGIGERWGLLVRWLALFPGLERIEITGVVRGDGKRSPGAWEAERFRRALAGKENVVIVVNDVEI